MPVESQRQRRRCWTDPDFIKKYLSQIPFVTYTEEELKQVPGEFTPSPFVKKITGVDNVCERSAVLASGNGRLLQRKTGENGVTTAVAAREWRIHFE